ncbi:MAG: cyclic nucleotide-binding domain-containing protein [Planctomycetota bacterium]
MAKPRASIPLVEVEKVLPIVSKIALFGGMSDAQLYTIFRLLQTTHYAKGEAIFEAGDEPSDIYIVWEGRVELILGPIGSGLAEAVFGVGESFGEAAVIGIERHTASAIATEDTELIVLPRQALFDLWDSDTELFGMLVLNIAREACRRLCRADEVLLHYFANGR